MNKKTVVILCGPTRTSTTSFFRFLSGFKIFSPSKIKETNFLIGSLLRGERLDLNEYFSLFESGDEVDKNGVYLEASPLYFMYGEELASYIKEQEIQGVDFKILITLRDPLQRFESVFKHVLTKRSISEGLDVDCFFRNNIEVASALRNPSPVDIYDDLNSYCLYESCYAKLCGEWINSLGFNSVKVVYFDSLSDEEAFNEVCKELFSWIGVGVKEQKFTLPIENKSQQVKFKRLHVAALRVNDFFEPILNRFSFVRGLARRFYYWLNGSPEKLIIPSEYMGSVCDILINKNSNLDEVVEDSLLFKGQPSWVRASKK